MPPEEKELPSFLEWKIGHPKPDFSVKLRSNAPLAALLWFSDPKKLAPGSEQIDKDISRAIFVYKNTLPEEKVADISPEESISKNKQAWQSFTTSLKEKYPKLLSVLEAYFHQGGFRNPNFEYDIYPIAYIQSMDEPWRMGLSRIEINSETVSDEKYSQLHFEINMVYENALSVVAKYDLQETDSEIPLICNIGFSGSLLEETILEHDQYKLFKAIRIAALKPVDDISYDPVAGLLCEHFKEKFPESAALWDAASFFLSKLVQKARTNPLNINALMGIYTKFSQGIWCQPTDWEFLDAQLFEHGNTIIDALNPELRGLFNSAMQQALEQQLANPDSIFDKAFLPMLRIASQLTANQDLLEEVISKYLLQSSKPVYFLSLAQEAPQEIKQEVEEFKQEAEEFKVCQRIVIDSLSQACKEKYGKYSEVYSQRGWVQRLAYGLLACTDLRNKSPAFKRANQLFSDLWDNPENIKNLQDYFVDWLAVDPGFWQPFLGGQSAKNLINLALNNSIKSVFIAHMLQLLVYEQSSGEPADKAEKIRATLDSMLKKLQQTAPSFLLENEEQLKEFCGDWLKKYPPQDDFPISFEIHDADYMLPDNGDAGSSVSEKDIVAAVVNPLRTPYFPLHAKLDDSLAQVEAKAIRAFKQWEVFLKKQPNGAKPWPFFPRWNATRDVQRKKSFEQFSAYFSTKWQFRFNETFNQCLSKKQAKPLNICWLTLHHDTPTRKQAAFHGIRANLQQPNLNESTRKQIADDIKTWFKGTNNNVEQNARHKTDIQNALRAAFEAKGNTVHIAHCTLALDTITFSADCPVYDRKGNTQTRLNGQPGWEFELALLGDAPHYRVTLFERDGRLQYQVSKCLSDGNGGQLEYRKLADNDPNKIQCENTVRGLLQALLQPKLTAHGVMALPLGLDPIAPKLAPKGSRP